ncbi:acetyltransferase [Methylobacterium sp. Leaf399]|uniref:CatB-related O-acetyltransferase n=1 Tax=unclassified Methylobacterium TaxID=2615210 RepID=UPI0007013F0E|nr:MULTISPECIES: CatB-related O-acetyltransferase [unclassified Methylobacterium]KQP61803.1 acetyltransferase [Methylobacterium sp. Leaf108]KQT20071.1 acetyltransferase [Methylobacterium sp. Leaf399]
MSIPQTKIFPNLTRLLMAWEIAEFGWEIGEHTYGRPTVLEAGAAALRIGRYCSIASDVVMVLANHRMDLVTTYPFKTLSHLWPSAAAGEDDHASHGDIVIGDDVWIGTGAMILSGSDIGTGAVVAARSVVRGVVPPYAIVAGTPARVMRRRFDDDTVARLLATAWWSWPEDKLGAYLPLMLGTDIHAFLARAEAERDGGEPSPEGHPPTP